MTINMNAIISNNVRELIQANIYEDIICNIMNLSSQFFPNRYKHVYIQSHGECDFIDEITGQKYDAKILFKQEQCRMIANNEFINWINSMTSEAWEFGKVLRNGKNDQISKTTLFIEMEARLKTIKSDEDAIFFLPYPIVLEFKENVYAQFAVDILSKTYNAVKIRNLQKINDKRVYIIYPSMESDVVIRELSSSAVYREHIATNEFSKYISYSCT